MKYKIVQPIVLGFLIGNDSEDYIIDAGTLQVINGDIVFTGVSGKDNISHTTTNAIDIWLKQGKIQYDD